MKIEFEKQFGKGVDPWYAKAERWAKKQRFPISHLALGLIAYLKKVWTNVKIENTMRDVDRQVEDIKKGWDGYTQPMPKVTSTPSEVEGLDDIEIEYNKYYQGSVVWSIVWMIGILLISVGVVIYYIMRYDHFWPND